MMTQLQESFGIIRKQLSHPSHFATRMIQQSTSSLICPGRNKLRQSFGPVSNENTPEVFIRWMECFLVLTNSGVTICICLLSKKTLTGEVCLYGQWML